jgi:hypothetical protein
VKNWTQLADEETVLKVVDSLKKGNFEVLVVENGDEARKKVLEIIPKGAEVMTASSKTLEQTGLAKEINESGNYDSVKAKLMKMDRATQGREMQKLGAAPEWVMGSIHAVTIDGHIYVASATGSQLGAYAYGSAHVIWVAGTQKIVKDENEAMKRVYEYCLPKESERQMALGSPTGSNVAKLLIINREFKPGRVTIIFVKKNLGV